MDFVEVTANKYLQVDQLDEIAKLDAKCAIIHMRHYYYYYYGTN